ncbi:MAG TPA: hypothetical protein VNN80_01455 [Polyangiaceae bacterium]|jgi:hypothetical protein|nr:hypothetical protein [Polyangiaceae bacterium]
MTNPSSEPASDGGAPTRTAHQRVRLGVHLAVVLVSAGLAGGVAGGAPAGVSLALGVALSAANLLLMRRITSALASGGSGWLMLLPFKLVALVGVAYALVAAKVAQPVPLALGFALLPLTAIFLPRSSTPLEPPSGSRRPAPSSPALSLPDVPGTN